MHAQGGVKDATRSLAALARSLGSAYVVLGASLLRRGRRSGRYGTLIFVLNEAFP